MNKIRLLPLLAASLLSLDTAAQTSFPGAETIRYEAPEGTVHAHQVRSATSFYDPGEGVAYLDSVEYYTADYVEAEDGSFFNVGIERLHLEQDAGKSMHDQSPTETYVDLNRAGVALMEIVSRPDMRGPEEAAAYVAKLRQIMRYLGTCDGNMQNGNLRADVNVSVRRPGGPQHARDGRLERGDDRDHGVPMRAGPAEEQLARDRHRGLGVGE